MALANPFYVNYSERMESDAQFLRLYSPGVLNALPRGDELWSPVTVIRSGPGGGKTSLLRLFTPGSLLTLHAYRAGDAYKDLFAKLNDLGAISDAGPTVIGAVLSLAHTFRLLADVPGVQASGFRPLVGLLNARIALAVLRSAMSCVRARYPDDLARLEISPQRQLEGMEGLPTLRNGDDVYRWACDIERQTCELADNPGMEGIFPGHNALFSLFLLAPTAITFEGRSLANRVLVMLDDFQYLHPTQRHFVFSELTRIRPAVNVWIAERLGALTGPELLGSSQERRDLSCVYLESFWRSSSVHTFISFAGNVADRRAELGSSGEVTSFRGELGSSLDEGRYEGPLTSFVAESLARLDSAAAPSQECREWLAQRSQIQGQPGLPFEQARAIQATAILLERQLRKRQMSFSFAAPEDDLSSDVAAAAELFVSHGCKMPYYFGFERLCQLASYNVEQFLLLAGDHFQHMLSRLVLGQPALLTPEKQHELVRRRADEFLAESLRRVPDPTATKKLIFSIGAFCREQTYQPNAPYAPGVTGIGMLAADRDALGGISGRELPSPRLARVISTCIAENLMSVAEPRCKGQHWFVLYLNRLLCAAFDLPLQYGGWRPRTLRQLDHWLVRPWEPSRNEAMV